MYLLTVHCRRLNHYTKLLRTPAVSAIYNRFAAYDSTKFPGYKVVYVLDHIQRIGSINRLKYRISISTAVFLPVVYGLLSIHSLSYETAVIFAFYTLTTTLFFHAVGIFCNNVVGYIYAKNQTKEVIVSYVDFWGRRIDVNTKYADINITESNNIIRKSTFNDLKIDSHNKTLKFYINGKILDDKLLDKICGINFE
ncbi:uncharacterized protein [Chelonus insularis]|uniref:uncharacterized protein n=1 Tax=Chelonus insularis TaxID=460826 RepID=UPI00158B9AA0|nr:uncharacterized protein LOC118066906 [Chelonus insularis]